MPYFSGDTMHPDLFKARYNLPPMQYEFEKFANQFVNDTVALVEELKKITHRPKDYAGIHFHRPSRESLYFDFTMDVYLSEEDNSGYHRFERETGQFDFRGNLYQKTVVLPASIEKFVQTYLKTHDVFTQMLLNQLSGLVKTAQFNGNVFSLLKEYAIRHPLTFNENEQDKNDTVLQYREAFVVLSKKAWDKWEKKESALNPDWQDVFFNGYGERDQRGCCHYVKCNGTQDYIKFIADYNDVRKQLEKLNEVDYHQCFGLVVLDVLVLEKELLSNAERFSSPSGYQLGWWNLVVKSVVATQEANEAMQVPDYYYNDD